MIAVEFGAMRLLSTEVLSKQAGSPHQGLYRVQEKNNAGKRMINILTRVKRSINRL